MTLTARLCGAFAQCQEDAIPLIVTTRCGLILNLPNFAMLEATNREVQVGQWLRIPDSSGSRCEEAPDECDAWRDSGFIMREVNEHVWIRVFGKGLARAIVKAWTHPDETDKDAMYKPLIEPFKGLQAGKGRRIPNGRSSTDARRSTERDELYMLNMGFVGNLQI